MNACMRQILGYWWCLFKERRWTVPGSPAWLLLCMISTWCCSKTSLGEIKSLWPSPNKQNKRNKNLNTLWALKTSDKSCASEKSGSALLNWEWGRVCKGFLWSSSVPVCRATIHHPSERLSGTRFCAPDFLQRDSNVVLERRLSNGNPWKWTEALMQFFHTIKGLNTNKITFLFFFFFF